MTQNQSNNNVMEEDLEKQLHEQYAVNANNNLTAMITIAIGLLSVIGLYGYVFIHTKFLYGGFFIANCNESTELYTTNTLVLAGCVALIVLTILYCISLTLGAAQRYEQFITFAIRCKYYNRTNYYDIFPPKYHPFHKGICDFVQGLHNLSLWVYTIVFLIITISIVIVLVVNGISGCSYNNQCHRCSIDIGCHANMWIVVVFIFTIIITSSISIYSFCKKYDRYIHQQKTYSVNNNIKNIIDNEKD